MSRRTLKELHRERLHQDAGQAPAMRVAVVNLGCVRNTVDSQSIIGTLERKGHALSSVDNADVVVVNTCGFIEDAKKESIDTILELLRLKERGKIRKVVVAGCLAQRYARDLQKELKDVDAFIGVQSLSREALQASPYLTPPHYAYVKICESCFNACSFCAIPGIKGKFASRDMEAVLADVKRLDERGVREINMIGQDVTAYGLDIYRRKALADLLKKVARTVSPEAWVRLLYMHPAHITDELLDVIASEPRVCKYLDIPLQHVSTRVLKAMNRKMTYDSTVALVKKIRRVIPEAFLRTTFIAGFPGETKEDLDQLLGFIEEHPFERVGVFMYSREEGTPAYDLPGRVPAAVVRQRYARIMELQQGISARLNARFIGKTLKVLIEERVKDEMLQYIGRSAFDAPDVDGVVHVRATAPLRIGDFAMVRLTGSMEYDLQGDAI
jgi:ribosomal protein S12 methylthiotransferase